MKRLEICLMSFAAALLCALPGFADVPPIEPEPIKSGGLALPLVIAVAVGVLALGVGILIWVLNQRKK